MTTAPRASRLVLAALLLVEVATFGAIGHNFFTARNAFEIVRTTVEIGLLAVALTPVIVGGGIDLSVGSMMGLSAVAFGLAWRDFGLPIWAAAVATIALGGLAGSINGLLITRLRLPPLIVTLGSFSLFRGLAEGLTGGVDNVTNFPASFLGLGQGYLFGTIPTQLPVFVAVAAGFWTILGRGTAGRGLSAIGFSPDGARHAGIAVDRLLLTVYTLSGLVASLAAIIYVAHLGQAKSDAGTGYELLAITAVVLGGTSIFGGRGGVGGTLLGLAAIAVLQNGLRLADLPAELAGVATGALLLAAIGLDRWAGRPRAAPDRNDSEEFLVKNAHVALICIAIFAAAAIVAASNVYLARTLVRDLRPPGVTVAADRPADPRPARRITVAMMPKSKGNAYFIACKKGADEAAAATGVDLIWDGPTDPDPAKQNEVIDTWITRGVDALFANAAQRG